MESKFYDKDKLLILKITDEIDDHNVGKFQAVGHPIKFEKTPANVYKCSPLLGEETVPVLKELGYTDEQISELEKNDIIQIV